jgi:NADH dehydrogenase FAD-containing subunit
MLTQMLHADPNISIKVGTKLIEVTDSGAIVETNGVRSEIPCYTVVLAMGMQSEPNFVEEFEGKGHESFASETAASRGNHRGLRKHGRRSTPSHDVRNHHLNMNHDTAG